MLQGWIPKANSSHKAMACCPPSCVIPCSTPSIGIGSCGIGSGYGGGFGYSGFGYGGGVSSTSLGMTSGAPASCISQIPPSEVVIQPSPCVITMPGAILSSSCEPMTVGGYSPCASGSGYGYGGGSYGGFLGGGFHGGYQGICRPRRNSCKYPC
ncbi:Feather keratin 3 [Varanus komodoensis]|nr:Feather keratin 3 [Varanus komodoensis]